MGMIRLVAHLSRGSRKQPSGLPAAELLSIAVARDARGQGVAERLYRSLGRSFAHLQVNAFKIIVGAHLNESQRAHRFYTRMGARDVGVTEVHAGQPSTVYVAEVRAGAEEDKSS
jgi:ribosomal protein S18 acetylase RimI-like enzyme